MTSNNTGTLYLVATPIGNLEDITLRALRILKEADIIACEDTRQTLKLLNHFDIKNRLIAYHKFNEKREAESLAERLLAGETVALVSDAGLPLISDPGSELVRVCREKGIPVTVVPGPNAALSALMLSGMDARRFTFFGFPGKAKKEERLFYKQVLECPNTAIVYESPHHIKKGLKALQEGAPEREISVSRELTKRFEETLRGTPGELLAHFEENEPKGEFALVIEGAPERERAEVPEGSVPDRVAGLMETGLSEKEAIKQVAKERGLPKREVYEIVKIKNDRS